MTFYALASPSAPSAPRIAPPKKKEHHWWDTAIEGAGGILAGVVNTGYHAIADPIGEVATGGSWDSKIDDVGKAIVDDYKHRYSSWDNFKDDPLAGVLDVLTVAAAVFTFGGSLAARTAASAATVGKAAKIAGLAESADLTNLYRASQAARAGTLTKGGEAVAGDAIHSALVRGIAHEELDAASKLGRKGVIDKLVSGNKGRVVITKDGRVLTPARGELIGLDGSVLETIPLAQSPLRRSMTKAGLRISNDTRITNKGMIGSAARASKLENRVNRIKDESVLMSTFGAGGARAARNAAKKMSEHEEAALFARNIVGTAEHGNTKLAEMYGKNADELEQVLTLPSHMQARIRDEAIIGARAIKAAAGKGGKIDAAKAQAHAMEEVARLSDEAKAAANPGVQQRLLQQKAAAAKIAEAAGKDDFENYVRHKVNLTEAMRDKDTVLQSLRARQALLLDEQVNLLFKHPTKLMLRVEKAQGQASRFTTDFIKGDLNNNVREGMADGSMLARMAVPDITDEELAAVVVRPHSKVYERSTNVREVRQKYAKRPSAPKDKPGTVPEFSKFSRGYTFAYAQDSLKPAAVFKVWNEARAYKAKTNILRSAARSGIRITSEEQRRALAATGHYEFVGGNADLLKKASVLRDKLDNEVRLIVGDSIAREEASNVIGELLENAVGDAAEYALPKVYHKYLTQELTRADNFVTRLVDAPTAIFRAAVLNLRPAWMVNNFVGQSMLLLYSQGVLHGTREYMSEVNRFVKARRGNTTAVGKVLDEKAGALAQGAGTMGRELAEAGLMAEKATGLGWLVDWPGFRRAREAGAKPEGSLAAHTIALSLKAIPSGLKGLADAMGHINSVLTDDIPRRAAFMGEVRPILAKMERLHPGVPQDELLRMALADDHVTARLVDKTMGDLIDFSRMNQAEREVVRRLLPFYGWMKGITLRTGRLVRDNPKVVNFQYALGKQYVSGAEDRFGGAVPENLKGAFLLGHDDNGNPRIMPANGMNNFQTVADIGGMVGNLLGGGGLKFGGTHPLSQVNPIVKSPLEVATGRDFFFGGPLYSNPEDGLMNLGVADKPWTPEDETRSNAAAIGSRYLASLGPMALYQRYKKAGPFEAQEQRLFVRDGGDTLSAFLGRPAATLNRDRAAAMANGGTQYAIIGFDPSAGESPGVFGRQRSPSTTAPVIY